MDNNLFKNKIFFKLRTNGDRNNQKQPPKIKWKDESNWFTYKEIKNFPNIGMFIPKGFILVDIDDQHQANAVDRILKAKNIKTIIFDTGRGKHFLFKENEESVKKQQNETINFLGIRNSTRISGKGYSVVKLKMDSKALKNDDGARINLFSFKPLNELSVIPWFLNPLTLQTGKRKLEIVENKWKEGQRDVSLKDWVLNLWKKEVTTTGKLYDLVSLIDSFIMETPLFGSGAIKELKDDVKRWCNHSNEVNIKGGNIKGENTHKKNIYNYDNDNYDLDVYFPTWKNEINYIDLANALITSMNLKFYKEKWWIKKKKRWYEETSESEIKSLIIKEVGNNALKLENKKIFETLKAFCERKKTDDDINYINLKNGRYNIKEYKLTPYSNDNKKSFYIYGIDINYLPDEYKNKKNMLIDKTMDQWTDGDPEILSTLYEFIGSTFYRSNEHSRALILYSVNNTAGNGKSKFMSLLKMFFSSEQIASSNLTALERRFGGFDIIGKQLLQISELDDTYIEKSQNFKAIVTGDPLTIEVKNKNDRVRIFPTVKVICATNRLPRFGDHTDGIWRRLLVIPFGFQPTPKQKEEFKNQEKNLENESSKERLLYLAIQGLQRFINRNGFKIPEKSKKIEEMMQLESNPLKGWAIADDLPDNEKITIGKNLNDNYSHYRDYCVLNNYKPIGRNKFERELISLKLGYYFEQAGAKKPKILRKISKVATIIPNFKDHYEKKEENKKENKNEFKNFFNGL